MNHLELGSEGESRALNFLQSNGHEILETNFKWKRGEIDIISLNKGKLVVTEVKTRNSEALGSPVLSITKRKQKQIISITNQFVKERNLLKDVRFDVVLIVLNKYRYTIEHIEDAFYPIV